MITLDEARINAWIEDDPDPHSRDQLRQLLTRAQAGGVDGEAANTELADAFSGELTFGTAGLRGRLGAGPNRMNRAVVQRASAGLVNYLRERVGADFHLVVGYDARYGSKQFALDTAAIAVGAGGRASVFAQPWPTPLAAFALRHLEADAAVMVTASHNPAQDNGYKVYLGGRAVTDSGQGAQIVPPADRDIFAQIQAVTSLRELCLASSGWDLIGEDVHAAYLRRISQLVSTEAKDLRIVLTAMHGVGGATCIEALQLTGFTDVHSVAAQHEPNPDFPTVAFPNPEEAGALDLSYELAREMQADLIIANDPDADRCSAAIPDPTSDTGWRQLTGDEVGALLGEAVAGEFHGRTDVTVANSVVSSRLLAAIARSHGISHRQTLTGFKWISRVDNLVFGYEEALGYCVDPAYVRDKDGISAAVRIATMAAQAKAQGRSLQDELDDLALRHGLHATAPLSIRVEDLSLIAQGMANLRAGGLRSLAGSPLQPVVDLSEGSADLPPTDGLVFLNERGDRVVARPSGTEPKLKCYLETVVPVVGADVTSARRVAAQRLEVMKADMRAALGI